METNKMSSVLYGPKPCKRKRFFWKFIIFITCAILGGILFLGYKMISTIYGPPPIDEGQQIIDVNKKHIQECVYGPPPIEIRQRPKDNNKKSKCLNQNDEDPQAQPR